MSPSEMSDVTQDVQDAHDELLRGQPETASHDVSTCVICVERQTPERPEEASLAEERTFTEAEHQALLQGAIEREVAQAVQDRDSTIAELEQRIDVLESEKAAAEQAKDEVQTNFDAYKAEVEQAKEIAERKTERVERVKAAAIHLPDDYFTDERSQRWAEMADEAFDALVQDFADSALAGLSKEEAKELEGLEGDDRRAKYEELRARRQERAGAGAGRETAAFGGGGDPGEPKSGEGTTFGKFLRVRRGEPTPAGK